jgi:glycosyltransferase involved in cell wall biosynthesis
MFLGTYDLSKPRNRILVRGLRAAGAELVELHEPVWEAIRDKSTLGGLELAAHLGRTLRAYRRLVRRFLSAQKPDVVLIGYLGQLDVVLLGSLAKLRGIPVVWDQFISLYDTVVEDRALVPSQSALARLIYAWEWLACRCADTVWMDTVAHAAYVRDLYALVSERVDSVWVGVEAEHFLPLGRRSEPAPGKLEVVFYGQFIALHGIDTIVHAARLLEDAPIHFSLIGSGQEGARIRAMLLEWPLSNLSWEPWVEYDQLAERLHRADVCLGIFGTSGKANRVIPNKVFQIVSAQRPLITRESEAIREMFRGDEPGLWLVPAGDPEALADRLRRLAIDRSGLPSVAHVDLGVGIAPVAIGRQAISALRRAVARARRGES